MPHSVVLTSEDLYKAYNRGSHMLVVDDLHAMHTPNWLLDTKHAHGYQKTHGISIWFHMHENKFNLV